MIKKNIYDIKKRIKNKLFISFLIISGLFLYGCDLDNKYYYETFRISKLSYVLTNEPLFRSYDSIKSYRNTLKLYTVESINSNSNVSKSDVFSQMKNINISPNDIDEFMSYLNTNGNNILYCQYKPNNNYLVIFYAEKL